MEYITNTMGNNLENQRKQVVELMQNKEFLDKISKIENIQEFIKYFEGKGIKMSTDDAKRIFKEKEKIKMNFENLSESELAEIYGGDTIIINNNVSSSSGGERHPRKEKKSKAEPMTALGGTITGSVFTLIGLALTGVSIYKWKKRGPDSRL